jgi:hypothetical protein
MAKLTEAEKRKNWEKSVGSSENDMEPLPKPKGYSREKVSSNKPEPTFKSDVDNIISGVKKADDKINEALTPVRKVMVKAAGKEEPGLLGEYSGLSKNLSELKKKKGGKITAANYDKEYGKIYRKAVKKMSSGGTASSRADGIATKGKTRGKIC